MGRGFSCVFVAMEPVSKEEQRSTASPAAVLSSETPLLAVPHHPQSISLSWTTKKYLRSSTFYMDHCQFGFPTRSLRAGFQALPPLPEPQTLRLRPASLRTQDISHLLARVFRNLYTAQVIGDDLCHSLIKARGSEDARHEEFLNQLQQVLRVHPGIRPVRMQPHQSEEPYPHFIHMHINDTSSASLCARARYKFQI